VTGRVVPLAVLFAASLALGCHNVVPPSTPPAIAAAPADVESTLFLIGDAGAPLPDDPVLEALTRQAHATPAKAVIVFLGDNLYPRGLPDSSAYDYREMSRRLKEQVEVALRTKVETYFIPGNHDWGYMGPNGWDAMRRETAFVDRVGAPYAHMLPKNGCPGPEAVDVGSHLRLVMLDTQWWLHDFAKPAPPDRSCPAETPDAVLSRLAHELSAAGGRNVVVMGHHPLRSGGEHGGHFGITPHFFPLRAVARWLWVPLPILGSYVPLARKQGASNQDISGPKNVVMRRAFEQVFDRYKPLVYAAGHDHDLQVLDGENARTLLVSGAGFYAHVGDVAWRGFTRFAAAASGFMRLDVLRDGRVRLSVQSVDADARTRERYSAWLE
jgi:hypothetical protein